MDVMEFFQKSAGRWRSQRTTHHLAFQMSESGKSEIQVETLACEDPRIIQICKLHNIDPESAIGGAFVAWQGSMAWAKGEEQHDGSTIFALIPNPEHPQEGTLLRDQGYAETVPVAGRYRMDEEEGLLLTTDYETMSSVERFWFASPNLRLRSSTVKRFGGFTTATFCSEIRIIENADEATEQEQTDVTSSTSPLNS